MDEARMNSVVKAVIRMADSVEEIPSILQCLALVPIDEWERVMRNVKPHQKRKTSGICSVCLLPYTVETTRSTYDALCESCYRIHARELRWLSQQRYRARCIGLPDELKLVDWLKTCEYFQDLCAYCQERDVEALDHFIPLIHGGGTIAANVVPACTICNRKKMYVHPDKVKGIPRVDIERVREYLNTLKIAS